VRTIILLTLSLTAACSGNANFQNGDASTDDSGTDDGSSDATTSNDGTTTTDAGAKDTGAKDSGTIVADSGDGFSAVRTACINEINKLRTGAGHAAYKLWETTAIDQCVDEQATYDQKNNSAHGAWLGKVYPTCNGNAQDECLGYGNTPSGIVACLDSMWNEKNQPNCSTCDSCNGPTLTQSILDCMSTSTCDFYGNYGGECGHYVNMSADYFVEAACGFSTVGSSKDWAVQNFQ